MLKVAMTSRLSKAPNYSERRDALAHDWWSLLVENQSIPIILPNNANLGLSLINEIRPELLILTGGGDVEDNLRKEAETKYIQYCIANKIPILGVCRGFQFLNMYFGGEVSPATEDHSKTKKHLISYSENKVTREIVVNSYHDNIIKAQDLAKNFSAIASDKQGNIEAAISMDYSAVGLMWHPEREDYDFFKKCCKRKEFLKWVVNLVVKK